MSPEQITGDYSIPESGAFRATFDESSRVQLCLFHIAQCWSGKLASNLRIVPDNTALQN
ncbi:hypothetical protein RO3G_11110 [Rhizopus delemar RA 99-880]|uniref:Uncharacterized protein n=1 Tax=Rhizopus delemar (strain RA 99-880 / ATCC MYA-4621 / FGSC 9543 / NRRL 43880) TaxID=246409 RepID=I1CD69_RHIO9|nr:hypothetical protein RO3G_11110 [Rhizopus delemar RA 99-880]|eukprot:EIE86399.1 hypothetical protein RO3G_11110 [Rhizopus delemar RA 99-880]